MWKSHKIFISVSEEEEDIVICRKENDIKKMERPYDMETGISSNIKIIGDMEIETDDQLF